MAKRGPKPRELKLPTWFKLQKYERAKTFNLKEWYVQLSIRESIKRLSLAFKEVFPIEKDKNWKLIKRVGIPVFPIEEKQFQPDRHISHAIIGMIYETEEKFPATIQKIKSQAIDARKPEHDIYFEPVPFVGFGTLLHVNLSKPDSEILEQFRDLLPQLRAKIAMDGKPVRIRRKIVHFETKTWVKFGLLPFLDLQLWAMSEKIQLTENFLAQSLNIDNDQIKETLKPLAKKLTDYKFLESLKARIQKG